MTVLNPARWRRHSMSCSIDLKLEKTIDLSVCFFDRSFQSSSSSVSILVGDVQSAMRMRLTIDEFLTAASSPSGSTDYTYALTHEWQKSCLHWDRIASSVTSSQTLQTSTFCPWAACFFRIRSG